MNTEIEDIYELSPLQQGILFHSLYAPPESGMYFEQFSMPVAGPVHVDAFRRAWQHVVDRHSALRTAIHWDAIEKPLQVVHRSVEIPFLVEDWSNRTAEEQSDLLTAFLQEDLFSGFELAEAPAIRVALFDLGNDIWQFNTSFHHIVLDGWSVALIFREFYESYAAFSQDRTPELPDTRPFGEYIAWLQSQDLQAAEQYWRRVLSGFKGPPRLSMLSADGEAVSFDDYGVGQIVLPESAALELANFARQQQVTINTVFQAAWALLLATYSGENDVVFGVTVSGRPASMPGIENMVGLFINTLPARVHVDWDASLGTWLRHVQATQFEARQYEYTPLIQTQAWSEVGQSRSLFDTLVVFENYPVDRSANGADSGSGVTAGTTHLFERTNYPLTLQVIPGAQTVVRILYMKPRIAAGSVERILGHLRNLLTAMAATPDCRIAGLPLANEEEIRRVTVDWNATAREFDTDLCVHDLFMRQAAATPDAIAVEFGDQRCTYRELEERSAALARTLTAMGVRLAGIHLERSIDLIVAVLGALRAGAAYVPFDRSYPAQRLAFMAESSGCSVLIARERPAWVPADMKILDIAAPPENGADPIRSSSRDLAYVLFTSGSTGEPKGVAMEHRSLVNLLAWQRRNSHGCDAATTLQFAPLSFDVSFQEIFSTLTTGGRLVLISDEQRRDPGAMIRVLASHKVERLFLPYVALQQLAEAALAMPETELCLRLVVTAGEQLKITEEIRKWFSRMPECILENQYGPTETHVVSSFTLPDDPAQWPDLPSIGRPIDNTSLYILDALQRPAPIEVVGQLYIGGVALAREYLNRPDLTSERFITSPFGGRLYRTGDLARYLPDGQVEFLGRADSQVKVRGYRVEIGEIEAALARHPAVSECACTVQEDASGEKKIIAYVTTRNSSAVPSAELSAFLSDWLPEYMIPAGFVTVGSMPLTPSGKVDRNGLPAWQGPRAEIERPFIAPSTALERQIAGMWEQVLAIDSVSVHDSFFELGGHSLLATRLASRLRSEFEIDFPLRGIFEAPTVAEQTQMVEALMANRDAPRPESIKRVARDQYVAGA